MGNVKIDFDIQEVVTRLGVKLEELVLMGIYAYEECRHEMGRKVGGGVVRRAVRTGAKALSEAERSVTFAYAVEECLRVKAHRRPNTLREIRSFMNRVMRARVGIGDRFVSSFTTEEWQGIIEEVFSSPSQRKKARVLLHGVFTLAYKRGWCRKNPLENVDVPPVVEKQVPVLSLSECQELMNAVKEGEFAPCRVAVALMLYAGVRPYEVRRLFWRNIDLEEGTILLTPRQTKTGGGRKITMERVLQELLREEFDRLRVSYRKGYSLSPSRGLRYEGGDDGDLILELRDMSVCPKNWDRRWKLLRESLGWSERGKKQVHWTPDVLRHTYASFHALYYKDFQRLQYEMGHRSAYLLQMRYVNMDRLTSREARAFFSV